jgi:hypothetical protein
MYSLFTSPGMHEGISKQRSAAVARVLLGVPATSHPERGQNVTYSRILAHLETIR